ncbi:hypothetical protein [Desulfosarcina ovata]|uniref:Uncharacterized protein n=1 Tax=Desulfosarcina ovata subsp. ovata TaxID=2752305 RepID=A0A5K8AB19_9BACT|nr:hypothetical protein [Desulfosarcina ovata]BBO89805.1 hypothetical protein DSCOOX_29850 [Desulfosarcina ovata subsp. ovata]
MSDKKHDRKREHKEQKKHRHASAADRSGCFYVVDACGCQVVDPCGCYVSQCCC